MFKSLRDSVFLFESFAGHNNDDDDDSEEESVYEEVDENGDRVKNAVAKETKRVRIWRWLVITMLLVVGASTSALTYLLLHGAEEEDFETSYSLFVDSIKDVSTSHFDDIEKAFQGLSEFITGAAITSGQTFPFVSVPQFEIQGNYARQTSGIEVLTFAPLVSDGLRIEWEGFAWDNQGWLEESRAFVLSNEELLQTNNYFETPINEFIYQFSSEEEPREIIPAVDTPFLPTWHTSPPPFFPGYINYNLMAEALVKYTYPLVQSLRRSTLSLIVDVSDLGSTAVNEEDHKVYHAQFVEGIDNTTSIWENPHSLVLVPVFEELNNVDSRIVGMIYGALPWDRYFANLLPAGTSGIYCVLKNTCEQTYTYKLVGNKSIFMGEGDFHQAGWDDMKVTINLYDSNTPAVDGNCLYSMEVYPSDEFYSEWDSQLPKIFASVVAATFVVMAIVFGVYDTFVRRRNQKVTKAANKTDKIVASLFPSNIRDRLLAEEDFEQQQTDRGARTRLKDFLANDGPSAMDLEADDDFMYKTRPIADLFPEVTIMFADICGFSAWSSTREPSQVFLLLETVYKAFDDIAKKRRVFKVETVGDCYVAAVGLPEPRNDHAVAMARFAKECMSKMYSLVQKLEVSLGPDTADLNLRVGLHSGPVTAGVLRGERSRFQLFGDTMNTASRMESIGLPKRIQVSQETADLLYASGKGRWLTKRQNTVIAKGKGALTCYWLFDTSDQKDGALSSMDDVSAESSEFDDSAISDNSDFEPVEDDAITATLRKSISAKTSRLIEWNKDLLARLLKAIVARRQALTKDGFVLDPFDTFLKNDDLTVLDEVQEVVSLPAFDSSTARKEVHPDSIELGQEVERQLGSFVSTIASMYHENPFHNFEHASHVTLSVSKLLSRIVAPTDIDFVSSSKSQVLHDHTYGITSDPLTQFSCVLSALIHDVDHCGVPNTQLVKENKSLAAYYRGRSVAEQNSVDVAWELLMDPAFAKLRQTIYHTEEEMKRFRQLIVNSVMATDIMDKDLKNLRNRRWERAFSEDSPSENTATAIHRKATIVIEHLIQASDVAHTMQHWHVYRKWNERLFQEMYLAYKNGRAEKNPADFWYDGEIGFFDYYIIPLAKKLKECGVFGVSSDEYLNYAQQNRREWAERGQEVVSELVESVSSMT